MVIGDLIGRKILNGPVLGVEVEVEGTRLPMLLPGFNIVKEGSLRKVGDEEGKEYVFQGPAPMDVALDKLARLRHALYKKDPRTYVQFSNRTSVHVHVNVTDLKVEEWFTFLFLWVLYEEALIHFCGDERKGNLFCLSSRDAEGLLFTLEEFTETGQFHHINDEVRYCAVNTAATPKYGSVEFRTMRGTMDENVLTPWLATLVSLRDKAQEIGCPKKLIDIVLQDAHAFTASLFPVGHFVYNFPDLNRSVMHNAFRCALFVENVNWERFDFIDEPRIDI